MVSRVSRGELTEGMMPTYDVGMLLMGLAKVVTSAHRIIRKLEKPRDCAFTGHNNDTVRYDHIKRRIVFTVGSSEMAEILEAIAATTLASSWLRFTTAQYLAGEYAVNDKHIVVLAISVPESGTAERSASL